MIKIAVNLALLLLISCRFLIEWFPLLGMPIISSLLAGILYLCLFGGLLYTLSNHNAKHFNRSTKILFGLYVIYSLYIIYYVIISPQIPRDDMANVPESDIKLLMEMVIIGITMFCVNAFYKLVNIDIWAKLTMFIILVTSIFYFMQVNILLYTIYRHMFATDPDMLASFGMIDSLAMGRYIGICFFCNLWLKGRITKNKWINLILFWLIAAYCFIVIVLIGQRGPILFLITTTLFYYYCKKVTSVRKLFAYLFVVVVLLAVGIFSISYISEDTAERFEGIEDDNGSGRFGDDDSEYNLAWDQIQQGPILGSYFRTTAISRTGNYPHNIVLEMLMTFGIVFSLPLFYILYKSTKVCFCQIRDRGQGSLFCLMFVYILSCLMTSGTIVLNVYFWLLLTLVIANQQKSVRTTI